ncbi:uncharacterized protein LOC128469074 [Spea bombifrons]|uniref:uncharacterized protein LOC128469074 n=1 Tax=Spea bombifrons TaxID=233779 RepID=UPI00234B1793|nr:uncharacterized protein LOC128469074 [Spea bombifrons]XP_053306866.1 uncharacterized protein LOC128469074 [Spea bombifrons]
MMESTRSSLGLLSGYSSSGSDDDDDDTVEVSVSHPSSRLNFFSNSDSCSDEEVGIENKKITKKDPLPVCSSLPVVRLPAPILGRETGVGPGGVFSNTFHEKQQAQLSVLEQHVKLSDSNWVKQGKGACLSYQRDGRCHFGTNCKYSHASDLPQKSTGTVQKDFERKQLMDGRGQMQREGFIEEQQSGDEKPSLKGKRKKPGLSNTLIPPKKALKNYMEQMATERS